MPPTTMRCGSPGVSGELSLLSMRESRTSGGGKTKPDSWPGGAPLRGEKAISEAEVRRVVVVVASTAEAGVGKDGADPTAEDRTGCVRGGETSVNVGGMARRGGDWEEEGEEESGRWPSRRGMERAGKSDIKAVGGSMGEGSVRGWKKEGSI